MERKKHLMKLMLDSGAYSVWSRGESIDLDEYIRFCVDQQELLYSYVNLDVIPGQFGLRPTSHQVNSAAAEGWKNYRRMCKAGLHPIPVYHIGERRYWLEKMIGEGAKYIGLGGLVGVRSSRRKQFLDETFKWLCSPHGHPPVKIHGFGVTTTSLIHRYPWFSVDSTSWVSGSKQGTCYIPQRSPDSSYDFTRKPMQVKFAETKWGEPDDGKVEKGVRHYVTLGEGMKKYIEHYINECGLDLVRIKAEYGYRCRLNAHFFKCSQRAHLNGPYLPHQSGFFNQDEAGVGVKSRNWKFRVVLVNAVTNGFCEALLEEKMHYVLHSFLDMKGRNDIEQYVNTGYFNVRESKRRNPNRKRKVLL